MNEVIITCILSFTTRVNKMEDGFENGTANFKILNDDFIDIEPRAIFIDFKPKECATENSKRLNAFWEMELFHFEKKRILKWNYKQKKTATKNVVQKTTRTFISYRCSMLTKAYSENYRKGFFFCFQFEDKSTKS